MASSSGPLRNPPEGETGDTILRVPYVKLKCSLNHATLILSRDGVVP